MDFISSIWCQNSYLKQIQNHQKFALLLPGKCSSADMKDVCKVSVDIIRSRLLLDDISSCFSRE